MPYSKHKDRQPLATIARIRSALASLGLVPTESWLSVIPGVHSLRLSFEDEDLGVNGKGTNRLYALASAYGELVERLSNQRLFKVVELGAEAYGRGSFVLSPDEVFCSPREILDDRENPEVNYLLDPRRLARAASRPVRERLDRAMRDSRRPLDRGRMLEAWLEAEPRWPKRGRDRRILCLPFYSLRHDRVFLVPERMAWLPCGTNGLAAGNTPEEALVQALSEIFERHALRRSVIERLTLPVIPRRLIETHTALAGIIRRVEAGDRFRLSIRDASLGRGLPVVAIIMIDRARQRYGVFFGGHPSLAVAVERCLTELLQGRDILDEERLGRMLFPLDEASGERADDEQNLGDLFSAGEGQYPPEFLGANPSYPFKPWPATAGLSNAELLRRSVTLVLDAGLDLMVRDVSFLGIPSYQVIVPSMSESEVCDPTTLEVFSWLARAEERMARLPRAGTTEWEAFIRTATDLNSSSRWSGLSQQFEDRDLMAAVLARLGRYSEARLRIVEQIAHEADRTDEAAGRRLAYLRCYRDYLEFRAQKTSAQAIPERLKFSHRDETVAAMLAWSGDAATAIRRYAKEYAAERRSPEQRRRRRALARFHARVKRAQTRGFLRQESLGEVFLRTGIRRGEPGFDLLT